MKKLVVTVVLLFSVFAFSQTPEALFSKANTQYKNGNYSKAIELYLAIEKQGLHSDKLYYNLGNSYYKLNKVAPSIYYYEKALKLNPANDDVISNLAFAKRMTIDVIEELPKTFLQKFSENVILKYSFDTWAIIAVIGSFFAAILFLIYYFSINSNIKLIFFNASILGLFVLIISTFFAFKNYDLVKNTKEAIIFTDKIEVKNAPTTTSDNVFELHEGTKVQVLDELDNWKKIKLADGKIGWITKSNLKII